MRQVGVQTWQAKWLIVIDLPRCGCYRVLMANAKAYVLQAPAKQKMIGRTWEGFKVPPEDVNAEFIPFDPKFIPKALRRKWEDLTTDQQGDEGEDIFERILIADRVLYRRTSKEEQMSGIDFVCADEDTYEIKIRNKYNDLFLQTAECRWNARSEQQ